MTKKLVLDDLDDLLNDLRTITISGVRKNVEKSLQKKLTDLKRTSQDELVEPDVNLNNLYQVQKTNDLKTLPDVLPSDDKTDKQEELEELPDDNQQDVNQNLGVDVDEPISSDVISSEPAMSGLTNSPLSDLNTIGMLSAFDLGKTYLLKKIYVKLISLKDNLNFLKSDKFSELKETVDTAIEIFSDIINNFELFKDKIDKINDIYQKFIVISCKKIDKILGE